MDIERYVRSWMATEGKLADADLEKLVIGLSSGNVTFLDIVKALGEYLKSEEDSLRTKGVQILSLLIQRCPRDKLNRQTVRVLTTFYCSKLEDTETVAPALCGLSQLATFPSFSSLEVSDVLFAVFQHVKMRSLDQATRLHVYNIINNFMTTYRDHLRSMGERFVSDYAALVTGEKDPRNLLIAFNITRTVLTEFDISKHVEPYFDITFCYYPIIWIPAPDDPFNVDDLRQSLRACLSATPFFGSLGTSLFLEKLALGSAVTKRDVLETLTICLPVYGISTAKAFGRNIWSALKLEIFHPTDSLTKEIALRTLRTFILVLLSGSLDGTDDSDDAVFRMIIADSLESVGQPEKSQAKAGIEVLCMLVDLPSKLGKDSVNDAIDKLNELFHDPGEVTSRGSVITLLTDLLNAFGNLEKRKSQTMIEQSFDDVPSLTILESRKDAMLGMLVVGLKTSATRLPAIRGLSSIIRIPALLSDSELGYIVLEAGEFAWKEPHEAEEVTVDAISLLSSIALVTPRHLADQTLPSLFTMLPEEAPSKDSLSERTDYWRALSILSKLCVHPTLFEILVIRLTAKLEFLCSLPISQKMSNASFEETKCRTAYAHALLLTLANTLSAKVDKSDPDVPKYVDLLLPHLFRLFLGAAVARDRHILQDQKLLRVCAWIVKLVAEMLSIEKQQEFIDGMCAAFIHGRIQAITRGVSLPLHEQFHPFRADASKCQRETAILFAAAHVPIRNTVVVMKRSDATQSDLLAFIRNLVTWCASSTCSTLQSKAASELFATIVNKYTDDIHGFLDEMLTSYFATILNDPRVPIEARRRAINIWVWTGRGLVVQSHPLASSFIDSLLTLLDDDAVAWDAARALGVMIADDEVLIKRNSAILKVLHVQKCFNIALPKVLDGARQAGDTNRGTAYLIALASLVSAVPKSMYKPQMSTLMPLLLRGLEIADPEIRQQIIETLSDNIDVFSANKSLLTHASTLVIALLKNCSVLDMPEPKVRMTALKCLALLPGVVRYDLLHPYKPRVLKDLAKALDDPKRTVRKEAVDARTKWYKYSG